MGYRTDFNIYVQSPPRVDGSNSAGEVMAALETLSGYRYSMVSPNAAVLLNVRWYELGKNLEEVSRVYPFARISIRASGEDGAEVIYNALGGNTICRIGVMTFPPNTLWDEESWLSHCTSI